MNKTDDFAKGVSNKQLLTDITNTETERDAYKKISKGFAILARLNAPEITAVKKQEYTMMARKYFDMEQECRDLLAKLNKARTERGI